MGETMTTRILLLGFAALIMLAGVAEARAIKIFNPTQHAIVAVQVKKPGATQWDRELLGSKVLGIGKVAEIDFGTDSACTYDLEATLDNGTKIEKKGVNICTNKIYSFTQTN